MLPDLPAVDRAFDYLVPDGLPPLQVGTVVRVPLHGRRVRGWVLELDVEPETTLDRLRPLLAVVSAGPPAPMVELCAWAAWRWAGPRAPFLRSATPPNRVTETDEPEVSVGVYPQRDAPIELPDGARRVIRWPPATPRDALVRALIATEGSTILVVPDLLESTRLAHELESEGRHVVPVHGGDVGAERTASWEAARHGACVVVGGRVSVLSPVPDLRAIVVLDDADEALKEERAPSWHALPLAAERARRVGARLDVVSPVPTVEALSEVDAAATAEPAAERDGWARVDVVDLRDEPPGAGLLSARLADTLRAALDRRERALCVVNRRGRARVLACRACREVARCAVCAAAVAEGSDRLECPRCGATSPTQCSNCGSTNLRAVRPGVVRLREGLAGLVPRARVLAVESGSAPLPAFDVAVGTEAVLHRAPHDAERPITVVAFLDFDQELLAPRYRAAEQALWLLVRASRQVGPRRSGGVVLVQTRTPDDPALTAARDGAPAAVIDAEIGQRRALAFPPFGGLAEISGEPSAVQSACDALAHDARLHIAGPATGRALLRAESVSTLCDAIAATDLTAARAAGRVRVDVDPLRV